MSRRGAAGIMQIRPVVARHFNIPVEMIDDLETNIRLAGMLLSELDAMLGISADASASDRLCIILAAYNAGVGHVTDARRLARLHGENPDSWSTVSRYLALKAQPEYYLSEAVRNGRFTSSRQTDKIRRRRHAQVRPVLRHGRLRAQRPHTTTCRPQRPTQPLRTASSFGQTGRADIFEHKPPQDWSIGRIFLERYLQMISLPNLIFKPRA